MGTRRTGQPRIFVCRLTRRSPLGPDGTPCVVLWSWRPLIAGCLYRKGLGCCFYQHMRLYIQAYQMRCKLDRKASDHFEQVQRSISTAWQEEHYWLVFLAAGARTATRRGPALSERQAVQTRCGNVGCEVVTFGVVQATPNMLHYFRKHATSAAAEFEDKFSMSREIEPVRRSFCRRRSRTFTEVARLVPSG